MKAVCIVSMSHTISEEFLFTTKLKLIYLFKRYLKFEIFHCLIISDLSGYTWTVNYFDENVTALVNHNMKITDQKEMVKAGNAIRKIYTPTTFKNQFGHLIKVRVIFSFLCIKISIGFSF